VRDGRFCLYDDSFQFGLLIPWDSNVDDRYPSQHASSSSNGSWPDAIDEVARRCPLCIPPMVPCGPRSRSGEFGVGYCLADTLLKNVEFNLFGALGSISLREFDLITLKAKCFSEAKSSPEISTQSARVSKFHNFFRRKRYREVSRQQENLEEPLLTFQWGLDDDSEIPSKSTRHVLQFLLRVFCSSSLFWEFSVLSL